MSLLQDTTSISHIIAGEIPQLLWFILAAFLIVSILPALRRKISDGDSDLKVSLPGGMEVSISKVREQVIEQITDLQNQVAELKKDLTHSSQQILTTQQSQVRKNGLLRKKLRKIMWVDDNPDNNALLIAKLRGDGFDVKTVTSTKVALELYEISQENYDLIISDMQRTEMLRKNPIAGIDLAMGIRESEGRKKVPEEQRTPIIIYTTVKSAKQFRAQVIKEDLADAIVSSPVNLMETIKLYNSDDVVIP